MEISPIIAQQALEGLEGVVMTGVFFVAAIGARRLLRFGDGALQRLRGAVQLVRSELTWRALPVLGLPAGIALPPVAPDLQRGRVSAADSLSSDRSYEPPWAGVSGFSPPRLLARSHGSTVSQGHVHPAIHGIRDPLRGEVPRNTAAAIAQLFPRVERTPAQAIERRRVRVRIDKRRAMRVHPAGTAVPTGVARKRPQQPGRRHVVRAGETLWGIAAEVLSTSDERRIARYWPLIHRANRDVIGRNPDLIFPGQVLHLPPEK